MIDHQRKTCCVTDSPMTEGTSINIYPILKSFNWNYLYSGHVMAKMTESDWRVHKIYRYICIVELQRSVINRDKMKHQKFEDDFLLTLSFYCWPHTWICYQYAGYKRQTRTEVWQTMESVPCPLPEDLLFVVERYIVCLTNWSDSQLMEWLERWLLISVEF